MGKVLFGGKTWESVAHLARAFSRNPSTVCKRLRNGESLSDIFNTPEQRGHLFFINDKTYTTKQLAKVLGITPGALRKRIADGWNPSKLVSPSRYQKSIRAFGRSQTLTAWSKECGINPSTIAHRIKNGLPPEVAIKSPVERRKKEAA